MKISEDHFSYQLSEDKFAFINRLEAATHKNRFLAMSTTPKKFIGVVHNDSFKLIGTWKPRAVACVAKGQLIGNTLKVSTSLHRAFLILFFFWLTIITGVGIFGLINLSTKVTDWMIAIFGLIVVASFFRLFLHIAYVVARRKFMIQFTDFLDHGGS